MCIVFFKFTLDFFKCKMDDSCPSTLTAMTAPTERLPLSLADLDAEVTATRRMLQAFPGEHASWKPHEKSRSLAALATHVAMLPRHGVLVLTEDGLDVAQRRAAGVIESSAELMAQFDAGIEAFRAAVATTSDAKLGEAWTLRRGDRVLAAAPRMAMLRLLFLSHLVHHRAQLGVCYRLLDLSVPGMYGPSADELIAA